MLKNYSGYIPANMPGGPTMLPNSYFNNYQLGWWNNKCITKHNTILVSAYHALKYLRSNNLKIEDFKNIFQIDEDVLIINDSGGFTNSTLGDQNLDPVEVLRFEEANGGIGLSLDIPPYNLTDESKPFNLNNEEFNIKMIKSYNNTKLMIEKRNNYDMKFYICIHGDNIERLERWYNLHKELKCEGYALAPKDKSNYWLLAQTLLWIYEKNIKKNIHLLAFSGITTIPILAYFLKYIDNLTYDSSSWAGGAMRREFILPLLKNRIMIGEKYNNELVTIPCNCNVCSIVNNIQEFHNKQYGGALMSYHNLNMFVQYDKILHAFKNNKEEFINILKKLVDDDVIKCIEYIDMGLKYGREIADRKYSHKLQNNNILIQQKSLFNSI